MPELENAPFASGPNGGERRRRVVTRGRDDRRAGTATPVNAVAIAADHRARLDDRREQPRRAAPTFGQRVRPPMRASWRRGTGRASRWYSVHASAGQAVVEAIRASSAACTLRRSAAGRSDTRRAVDCRRVDRRELDAGRIRRGDRGRRARSPPPSRPWFVDRDSGRCGFSSSSPRSAQQRVIHAPRIDADARAGPTRRTRAPSEFRVQSGVDVPAQ